MARLRELSAVTRSTILTPAAKLRGTPILTPAAKLPGGPRSSPQQRSCRGPRKRSDRRRHVWCVDSSTVAAMLKREGHDLVGLTMQL